MTKQLLTAALLLLPAPALGYSIVWSDTGYGRAYMHGSGVTDRYRQGAPEASVAGEADWFGGSADVSRWAVLSEVHAVGALHGGYASSEMSRDFTVIDAIGPVEIEVALLAEGLGESSGYVDGLWGASLGGLGGADAYWWETDQYSWSHSQRVVLRGIAVPGVTYNLGLLTSVSVGDGGVASARISMDAPAPVPEPASLLLLGLGLIPLLRRRERIR